jgi:hypothetical protein
MKWIAGLVALMALAGCAAGANLNDRRAAFLGRAAEPSAVIAAELAFARLAREKGTWTAFRATATDDAVWPAPDWQNVKAALKGRPDPAQPIMWEPDMVWSSCDGSFALSTGPATWPDGRNTRFATIWQRQDDGDYKWVLDQGLDADTTYTKPDMIAAQVAECGERRARDPRWKARRGLEWQSAEADDGTLAWTSTLAADCGRRFAVSARRGGVLTEVFSARTAAPITTAGSAPATCAT